MDWNAMVTAGLVTLGAAVIGWAAFARLACRPGVPFGESLLAGAGCVLAGLGRAPSAADLATPLLLGGVAAVVASGALAARRLGRPGPRP